MLSVKEEIIDTIIPIIEHDTEIELCLMYGSTVQDRLTERSDINLDREPGTFHLALRSCSLDLVPGTFMQ